MTNPGICDILVFRFSILPKADISQGNPARCPGEGILVEFVQHRPGGLAPGPLLETRAAPARSQLSEIVNRQTKEFPN